MTDLPQPLTPAGCDLRDFSFTPVEFDRLFSSETWLLSNDKEKVAALYLWGRSWKESPAGSIPAHDVLLAEMTRSASVAAWKKVKAMALRNWVLCSDGRYYHPIMCEKVLESWLRKLAERLSGGAGNAKRWGTPFDPTPIHSDILVARAMLAALNPKSKALDRKAPPTVPKVAAPHPEAEQPEVPEHTRQHPDGTPGGIPTGSQERGRETERVNTTTPTARGTLAGDRRTAQPMPLAWCPDPQTFGARLLLAGMPANLLTDALVGEFASYWNGKPDVLETQDGWEHKLLQRIIAVKNTPEKPHDAQPPARQQAHRESVIERNDRLNLEFLDGGQPIDVG